MAYGFPGSSFANAVPAGRTAASLNPGNALVRIYEKGLWSTQLYPAATAVAGSESRLFTTPKGQVGQGFGAALSLPETNMRESGRIQQNEAFDVIGISAHAYYSDNNGVVFADMSNLLNHSVLSWDLSTTQLEIAPVHLIGSGGGVFGDTADTGAAEGSNSSGSRISFNNGNGSVWMYQDIPMNLNAGTTFAILHRWGSLATAIDGGNGTSDLAFKVTLMGRFQSGLAAS